MKLHLPVLLSLAAAVATYGGPLAFQSKSDPPQVLMGFRQKGSSSEIVAVLGSIKRFTDAAPGSSFFVTEVSPDEVNKVFTTLDDVAIDIFASVVATKVTPGNPIFRTVWLVNPRTDLNTQTTPWARRFPTVQGPNANRIGTIGDNAVSYSMGIADGPDNDGNLVVMPSDLSYGYSANMGPIGNFKSTFYADTELTLPAGFADSGAAARMDFYELVPLVTGQSNEGKYLGYFEFGTDARLSFHAAGGTTPPSPAPVITGIHRDGSVNTITFSTLAGGYQYVLLRAPAAGLAAPIAQWIPVGSGLVGTGNPASLSDTNDSGNAYYRVQVSP
jgi:hypothetical protein